MRKHECSSLSLTIPLGLQTCKIIHYPHSPTTPLQLFSFFVWIFPHYNCIHTYCVSPVNGALPSVICVLHLQVILYTKEEVTVPPPQYINYKLIFPVMLTDHTTVFTLSSQSPCRYEPHWKPKSLDYRTTGHRIHTYTHKHTHAPFLFNL